MYFRKNKGLEPEELNSKLMGIFLSTASWNATIQALLRGLNNEGKATQTRV